MVGVVVKVIVSGVFVVEDGVIVDTGVVVHGVVVTKTTVFPCILIVVRAGLRRGSEAATPTTQRRRRRAALSSCDSKILVVVVVGGGNTVYLTINWSRRGLFVNRGAADTVVAQNCEHFQTRSGRVVLWWVECSCCCCCRCCPRCGRAAIVVVAVVITGGTRRGGSRKHGQCRTCVGTADWW